MAAGIEASGHPLSHETVKRMAEMGFLGINIPEELGGLRLSNLDALIVLEELAKVSSAFAFPAFEANVGPAHAIRHFAPDALKHRIVPAVCRGEMIVAVSMSEADAWTALTNADKGLPSTLDSSTAKCFVNQIARGVTGNAVQLMGGYGYSTAYPMERRMRDAWGWGIAGGSIDIQKVNIASAMVGRRFDQRR